MSMTERLEASRSRLQNARDIAVELKHDAKLHRLAMQTVFILEDCYESLVGIVHGHTRTPQDRPSTFDQPAASPAEDDSDPEALIVDTPCQGASDRGGESEPASHEEFLLEDGLEMLARYRAIRDPQMRLMIRQLIAAIANGQMPPLGGQDRESPGPQPHASND